MLAISNTYYRDFDEKSKQFIEQAIDYIEETFTGFQKIEAVRPTTAQSNSKGTSEKFNLIYFKQILTDEKTYNKQAVIKPPIVQEVEPEVEVESETVLDSQSSDEEAQTPNKTKSYDRFSSESAF
jgi:hypothetical protein